MSYFTEGLFTAGRLLFAVDPEVYGIVGRSLRISLTATFLASLVGIPLGFLIGSRDFRGKAIVVIVVHTLMALPTVVVGLLGYAILSRQAPLGFLELLFTPRAIIMGEFILSLPIITALTISAIHGLDRRAVLTAQTLGAGKFRIAWTSLMEARYSVLAAVIVGFGRAASEVGSAMMLGGNIRFYTRTMTTAIALETSKGEFGFALALGLFLLLVVFSVNILLHLFQMKGRVR